MPVIENRGFLSQDFNLHGWFAFNGTISNPFTGRLRTTSVNLRFPFPW
jgi:hypothetical protein